MVRFAPTRLYSHLTAVATALGILGALIVGSCRSAPLARPESAIPQSITLERSRCFGMCPAYRLTVERSGNVSFASLNPGDSARAGSGRVAPSVLDSLYARAVRIGFFALPDTLMGNSTFCSRYATDLPGATVTIATNAGIKSVNDYHGCAAETPEASATLNELRIFEAAIDTLTESSRWIQPSRR
jgi:hypothetical protein